MCPICETEILQILFTADNIYGHVALINYSVSTMRILQKNGHGAYFLL